MPNSGCIWNFNKDIIFLAESNSYLFLGANSKLKEKSLIGTPSKTISKLLLNALPVNFCNAPLKSPAPGINAVIPWAISAPNFCAISPPVASISDILPGFVLKISPNIPVSFPEWVTA